MFSFEDKKISSERGMHEVLNIIDKDWSSSNSPSSELDAPIAAIRPSSQIMLSQMLNPIKVIPTDSGLPRDWRGLAELAGLPSETISFLESKDDPTYELIRVWCQSQDSRCKHMSDLKAFLGVIDRFDVVDDVASLLVSDAVTYQEKVKSGISIRDSAQVSALDSSVERNILTVEDSERIHQGLPLTRYDAFILHSEDDSDFASQVVDKLENEYGLKLCVKDRDLLPGIMFEHEVIGRLIEERCNRFLVIFSPSFLESRANQFLVSYAQASALESRVRKIVPCIYKKCELPPSVRYSFSIVYNRSGKLWNFWDKLSQSLRPASTTVPITKVADNSQSMSLNQTESLSKFNSVQDSSNYWDAEKPLFQPKLSTYSLDSEVSNGVYSNSTDADDTLSIRSDAHLISSKSNSSTQGESKSSKWYKKIMSPMKKKRDKEGSQLTQKVPAE